jgi:hypothetical protein
LELTEWTESKRVDLRFWKDGTVPTKEGVSLLNNNNDVSDWSISFVTSYLIGQSFCVSIAKEEVSLHLDQWKALCNMSDVIDDLLTRIIEKEPVGWRYPLYRPCLLIAAAVAVLE